MLRLLSTSRVAGTAAPAETSKFMPGDSLRALAERAAGKEEVAERTLFMTVGPAMLGVVRRVLGAHHPEVDDVCQDSVIGLLFSLPGFRAECTVMHFACRVALLTALAARRRSRRRDFGAEVGTEEPDNLIDNQPSPAEQLDAARRRQVLRELLEELPMSQAEVLALHVMLGYTVEETAAMIGAPINTVRSRLHRGLGALRDALTTRGILLESNGGARE